jgi:multiple sugar transport system substrate-binding protein
MKSATSKLKFIAPLCGVMVSALACLALSGCGSHEAVYTIDTNSDAYKVDWSVDVKGTTINFWTPFGSNVEDVLEKEVVSGFESKYGVTVVCESQGGYDNLEKAVVLAASTNSFPQITLAYPDHQAAYIYSDILVALDYYFENDSDDNFNISDFYSDYMAENQELLYKGDGSPYTMGVPFNKSTETLSYNKTFFTWAGAKDSKIFVPTTWEEVKSVNTEILTFMAPYFGKIAASDYKAYAKGDALPSGVSTVLDFSEVTADKFRPLSYDSQSNFFITTCRQWGGEYTTAGKGTLKGYLAYDSDPVREGLSWMQDAYNKKLICTPDDLAGESTKYSSEYFKNLMTFMMIGSSAGVENGAPAGNKFKVGIAPIPYKDADHKYVISQGTNLVLLNSGTSAQRKASWMLLKYLSKEANGLWSALSGYYPSCDYAQKSKDYQEFINSPTVSTGDEINYDAAMVNVNNYIASGSTWKKFVDVPFIGSSTVRGDASTIMHELFNTTPQPTPDAVIKAHYSALKDYVK